MLSDEDDSFKCPICGEDLTESDSMWRQVHINTCLAKRGKPKECVSEERSCPVCGEDLSRLSAPLAEKHVNRCLDKKQRQKAEKRENERCPFCGMNIKNLTHRQRVIHNQTCQHTNNAQEADVVLYPKVVETLPTPEEWEIIERREPKLAAEKETEALKEEAPLIGKKLFTSDVQCIEKAPFFANEEEKSKCCK